MKSRTGRNPEIGKRIHTIRRERGLLQEDVAHLVGMSTTVLSRLERGKQSVSAERLAAIAKILAVSADYLLGL